MGERPIMTQYKLTRLNVGERGLRLFLGPLEAICMQAVWAGNTGTRTIFDYVRGKYASGKIEGDEIAFTSVTTTVNHLHTIGMLNRSGDRKRYTFTPTFSTEVEFVAYCLSRAFDTLLTQYPRESGMQIVTYLKGLKNAAAD